MGLFLLQVPEAPTLLLSPKRDKLRLLESREVPCPAGHSDSSFSPRDQGQSSLEGKFGDCHVGPTIYCHQRLRNFPRTFGRT